MKSEYPMPLPLMLIDERNGIMFYQCLMECSGNAELVSNYERLTKSNINLKGAPIDVMINKASGRLDAEMKAFIIFVWECVFLRFGKQGYPKSL